MFRNVHSWMSIGETTGLFWGKMLMIVSRRPPSTSIMRVTAAAVAVLQHVGFDCMYFTNICAVIVLLSMQVCLLTAVQTHFLREPATAVTIPKRTAPSNIYRKLMVPASTLRLSLRRSPGTWF